MPTVSLDMTRTWITLASDPDGYAIKCGSTQPSAVDVPLEGEIRYYAGGRNQAAIRDAEAKTLNYTLLHLSPADKDMLVAWRGKTVLLRTVEGEREFVVYFNCPYRRVLHSRPEDASAEVTFDAEVTFSRVTYSEAV